MLDQRRGFARKLTSTVLGVAVFLLGTFTVPAFADNDVDATQTSGEPTTQHAVPSPTTTPNVPSPSQPEDSTGGGSTKPLPSPQPLPSPEPSTPNPDQGGTDPSTPAPKPSGEATTPATDPEDPENQAETSDSESGDSPDKPKAAPRRGPTSTNPGTIKITTKNGLIKSTDTHYDISKLSVPSGAEKFEFTYQKPSDSVNRVVVMHTLSAGQHMISVPAPGTYFSETAIVGDNEAVFRIKNATTDATVEMQTEWRPLTSAQAAEWIDTGEAPEQEVYAEEWLLDPDTPLNQYSKGVKLSHVTYATLQPQVGNGNTVDATHTYDADVNGLPRLGNSVLNCVGGWPSQTCEGTLVIFNKHRNGMLRYQIPMYSQDMDLMELDSIKVYLPHENLELTGVTSTKVTAKTAQSGDLMKTEFKEIWDDATVGPRQVETSGPNQGKSYYLIKPGKRWFNNVDDFDLKLNKPYPFYGTRLNFSLRDADGDGSIDICESANCLEGLPHSTTKGVETVLQAADTVMVLKTVNGGVVEKSFPGPKLHVGSVSREDMFVHAYSPTRLQTAADNQVIAGTAQSKVAMTYTSNMHQSSVNNSRDKVLTDVLPTHDGPVVQTFTFPEPVQPSSIWLSRDIGTFWGWRDDRGQVEAITYTTSDGVVHQVPAATIDQVNDPDYRGNGYQQRSGKGINVPLNDTDGKPITKVEVKWKQLIALEGYTRNAPLIRNRPTGNRALYGNMDNVSVAFDLTYANVRGKYQVGYTLSESGNTLEPSNADWLWFDLVLPTYPVLFGTPAQKSVNGHADDIPRMADGGLENGGTISLRVGDIGEKNDWIDHPRIDIFAGADGKRGSYCNASSRGKPYVYYCRNVTNLTNAQALAFLAGQFTATKYLSGWTMTFTTNQRGPVTRNLGTITADTPIDLGIDFDNGEYLTAWSFAYDGNFKALDYSGGFDADGNGVGTHLNDLPLLKNLQVRALSHNPITGEMLKPFNGETYDLRIGAQGNWSEDINDGTTTHQMHFDRPDFWPHGYNPADNDSLNFNLYSAYAKYPGVYLTILRYLTFEVFKPDPQTSVPQIEQNPTHYKGFAFSPKLSFSGFSPRASLFHLSSEVPWDIQGSVYLEMIDPEINVVLEQSTVFGAKLDGIDAQANYVTVNGKRYLKVTFMPGFRIAPTDARTTRCVFRQNGDYAAGINGTLAAGCPLPPIDLKFHALSSAKTGKHWPIGKVYVDFSQLLEKYNAPEDSPASNPTRTNYLFKNAVPDADHLSDTTTAETNKLFMFDLSEHSTTGTPYAVEITLKESTGFTLVPGKDKADWAKQAPFLIGFTPASYSDLNALFSVVGPKQNSYTNLDTYLKVPRKGQLGCTTGQTQSQFSMYLTGKPTLLGTVGTMDTSASNLTYSYTSDDNPTKNSDYTYDPTTARAGWDGVTAVRIQVKSIPAGTNVSFRLDYRAEDKSSFDPVSAYSCGTYSYNNGDAQSLGEIGWQYGNFLATDPYAVVFWDTYDENGQRATSGAGQSIETGVAGVTMRLLSPDGQTEITHTTTGLDGTYKLESYLKDAGQILEITLPEGVAYTKGTKLALTQKSGVSYAVSGLDSDFDRQTLRLVLPRIVSSGWPNISIGLIRLPKVEATDVTLQVGQTLNTTATLQAFLEQPRLPQTSYNLTFSQTANTDVATVEPGTVTLQGYTQENGAAKVHRVTRGITGVKPGHTTATVYTKNVAGDVVKKTYNITVTSSISKVNARVNWSSAEASAATLTSAQPQQVVLKLQRKLGAAGTFEDVPAAPRTASAGNAWKVTFGNQPDYDDATGEKYTYRIVQQDLGNHQANFAPVTYTTDGDGTLVANNVLTPTRILVQKVWRDTGSVDHSLHQVTVRLSRQADGAPTPSPLETATIGQSSAAWGGTPNSWAHTFVALTHEPATGKQYTYSVDETPVPAGYVANVTGDALAGFKVVNTSTTNFSAKVSWQGDTPAHLISARPASMTIQLQKTVNGTTVAVGTPVVVNAAGNWQHDFGALPNFDENGAPITWSITSDMGTNAQHNYQTKIENAPGTAGGQIITNTLVPVTIEGTKTWKEGADKRHRPAQVSLTLKRSVAGASSTPGPVPGIGAKAVPTEDTTQASQHYSFGNQLKYDPISGNEYVYSVSEAAVTDYDTVYDGVNVTNIHRPLTAITINWDDNSDALGARPQSVTVTLLQTVNGVTTPVATQTATKGGGWVANFGKLPIEDAHGNPITYTVSSTPATLAEVTNYHTPSVSGLSVTYKLAPLMLTYPLNWNEPCTTVPRPDKVTVKLYQTITGAPGTQPAKLVQTKLVDAVTRPTNTQDVSFEVLAKDPQTGSDYSYKPTVSGEQGYLMSVTDTAGTVNINANCPLEYTFAISKSWNHDGNQSAKPTEVKVRLKRDGTVYTNGVTGIKEVTITDTGTGDWVGFLSVLGADFEDGTHQWTVEESPVHSYQVEYGSVTVDPADPHKYSANVKNSYVAPPPAPSTGGGSGFGFDPPYEPIPSDSPQPKPAQTPTAPAGSGGDNADKGNNGDNGNNGDGAGDTATIGDKVWNDKNRNGSTDPGEKPLVGIIVELLDKDGKVVGTTTTDQAGNYLFRGVKPGKYRVRFTAPPGVDFSAIGLQGLALAGSNYGITGWFDANPGQHVGDVCAGMYWRRDPMQEIAQTGSEAARLIPLSISFVLMGLLMLLGVRLKGKRED